MIRTFTTKNMVSVPAELTRMLGLKPGFTFDWRPSDLYLNIGRNEPHTTFGLPRPIFPCASRS